ncbi:MAG: RDD family protein [Nannocystales bacterium]
MSNPASQDGLATALDTTVDVETPEHVTFRVHVAGPSRRAVAYGVDLMIRGVVLIVLALVAEMAGETVDFENASVGVLLVVMFSLEWGYYILFESLWSGQTPGKRMLSLRTVKESGVPLTFLDAVLRNLLRGADWLPAFNVVGLVVMSVDGRFRRLGDMVAGTMVVQEAKGRLGSALVISPAPTPAEIEAIPASVRLSAVEMDVLESFLRRVGTLSPARELELAQMVAPMFAQRCGARYDHAVRFLGALFVRAGGHVLEAPTQRKTFFGRGAA